MASVRIRGAGVVYQGLTGPVEALSGIDLEVADGEPVSLLGPSGCGKSTLLLAVAGLVRPGTGSVEVDGEPLRAPRLRTALILQDFGLLPWKTVHDNAVLGLTLRHVPARERDRRAAEALERVGLSAFARAYPGELSGGMRQRLAMARALALDADLLLLDEPLSALDALTREALQGLLLELWQQRRPTALLVTHSIEEAVFLGRRIVVLSPRPGRVAAVLDNPGMGVEGYRATPEFYELCGRVRRQLAEEGAFAPSEGGRPS